ncbi:MAG: PilX N-terminal domain-containing pilus assembly protein [Pseudomonadota bacterium]
MKVPQRRTVGPAPKQEGAALIVLLVMLVVVTMLALSGVRTTTMDERMAGNARDRDKAFQAAEAAVRACLNQVNTGAFPGEKVLSPVASDASPATPHWEVEANWSDDTKSVEIDVGDSTLKEQPRCMVEALGAGSGSYRVTGKGLGGSSSTVVVLQATYSPE